MRLTTPRESIDIVTRDVNGRPFQLSDLKGKRVMLSFFRNADCPFCNLRVYELTHEYTAWREAGLEVVTFFSSPAEDVRAHLARGRRARPFRMIADPDLAIYNEYGVEQSATALFKALLFKLPRIFRGLALGGKPAKNHHPTLVPADFLLDERGRIVETWYGRDTSDHIPLERVQAFIDEGVRGRLRGRSAAA